MSGPYKLYILVRSDMSPEQQAVQAGHAVAQFVLDNPKSDWKNSILVYLRVKDVDSYWFWGSVIKSRRLDKKLKYGFFFDKDLHGEDPAAMYVYGFGSEYIFRDLPLMRFK